MNRSLLYLSKIKQNESFKLEKWAPGNQFGWSLDSVGPPTLRDVMLVEPRNTGGLRYNVHNVRWCNYVMLGRSNHHSGDTVTVIPNYGHRQDGRRRVQSISSPVHCMKCITP